MKAKQKKVSTSTCVSKRPNGPHVLKCKWSDTVTAPSYHCDLEYLYSPWHSVSNFTFPNLPRPRGVGAREGLCHQTWMVYHVYNTCVTHGLVFASALELGSRPLGLITWSLYYRQETYILPCSLLVQGPTRPQCTYCTGRVLPTYLPVHVE